MNTKRIDEYWKLLKDRYGLNILTELLIKSEDIICLKDSRKLTKTLIPYCRDETEGCQECETEFTQEINTIKFHERPMEFPGFINPLNFEKEHVKEVMIIGEAAGPTILTNLNIAFGLGWFHINENGEMNNKKTAEDFRPASLNDDKEVQNKLKTIFNDEDDYQELLNKFVKNNADTKFWEYLSFFFSDKFGKLKENVYISDLVKCNEKDNEVWKKLKKKCYDNFLKKEIRLINPRLIIFLGASSYEYVKNHFDFKEISPTKSDLVNADVKEFNFLNRDYLKKYYESKIKNLKSKFGTILTESEIEVIKKDKNLKIPKKFPLSGKIGKKFSKLGDEEIKLLKKCIGTKNFPIFGSLKHPSDNLKEIFFVKMPHTSATTINYFWSKGNYMYKDPVKKLVEKYIINRLNW